MDGFKAGLYLLVSKSQEMTIWVSWKCIFEEVPAAASWEDKNGPVSNFLFSVGYEGAISQDYHFLSLPLLPLRNGVKRHSK